ncbi:hypothetical protein TBLA_0C00690 [Henningerozyma blattae CBS 6284]|uniref:ATP-dependent RNA helicase n=1 Tax=Henningerozyma blattae (strain ATCC 34711 / CBS 6284 / DSM 70876 / NBRC 10599 / NRRL Y-10934 / UCD 77-7) TaxID=1071380 RepID=I2H0I3_HENB6|nr:hypothetical protein TBLA_0C00690 [Tetrapisispora blattae CBS 6284]CCH59885.1 hypothetical protein TBLA_0C00690 [Tetrapisispora blattae CBS 6284]
MTESLLWNNLKYELQPWIRTAIDVMGFERMTPVQASTIPMLAGNKDVVVDSVTGSGKTIAFVIPVLEKIISEQANNVKFKKGHFHTLIIAPTRELSKQIQAVIDSFLDHYPEGLYPIRSKLLVGTNTRTVRDDVAQFLDDRPQILVGTPGRILDFLGNPTVKTSSCSMVILDEADRLLDGSFLGDVENILGILPKQRRTGLFSATINSAGENIFKTGLRNPIKITVNSKQSAPQSLNIDYAVVKLEKKLEYLLTLLNNYKFKKCIVYFPTCIFVNYIYNFFQHLQKSKVIESKLSIFSLHGKLQTSSRMKTLDSFTQTFDNAILLTTDVAARGIDIPDVDLVIQVDPPTDSDVFLHRCGRTGRANRIGKAIVFLSEGREEDFVPFMKVKNVELQRTDLKISNLPNNFYDIFKTWVLEDRARLDLGIKVYVSFIRNYSKHSAGSIFRLQSFDYAGLCKMLGLFRLPRMPEITKHLNETTSSSKIYEGGWLIDPPLDLNQILLRRREKRKNRLDDLKNLKAINDKKKLKSELKKKNMSWSNKTDSKEAKAGRRAKAQLKRKAIEEQLKLANDSSNESEEEDWKELVLQKKRKKGVITDVQGSFDDL